MIVQNGYGEGLAPSDSVTWVSTDRMGRKFIKNGTIRKIILQTGNRISVIVTPEGNGSYEYPVRISCMFNIRKRNNENKNS